MRERDAMKRAAEREARETDENALESQRQAWRIKYARRCSKAIKTQIDSWLVDPTVNEPFKAFLKTNVLPNDNYRCLTPKTLEEFAFLLRQTSDTQIACDRVDGEPQTRPSEGEREEEESQENETSSV